MVIKVFIDASSLGYYKP